MVIDNTHVLSDGYSTVITVDKARDSADIKLANLMERGDVVVTQDFGVAAMALGQGRARPQPERDGVRFGQYGPAALRAASGAEGAPGGGQDGARSKSARPRTTKRFPTRWKSCWTNRVKRRPRFAGVFISRESCRGPLLDAAHHPFVGAAFLDRFPGGGDRAVGDRRAFCRARSRSV